MQPQAARVSHATLACCKGQQPCAKLAFYVQDPTSREPRRCAGWTVSTASSPPIPSGMPTLLTTIAVLIPVWQPPANLPDFVQALLLREFGGVVIVDDGSDAAYGPIFEDLKGMPRVSVIVHARNVGKGQALKSGLAFLEEQFPDLAGVVTADADGQHLPDDVQRVGQNLLNCGERSVLGTRSFNRNAPLKNRLGNQLTALIFRTVTRCKVSDTQTGLRGLPRSLWGRLLSVPGERYEYETAMLVELCRSGHSPVEVPIQTVYLNGNRSTHFRAVRDGMRIYFALLQAVRRSRQSFP